MAYTPSLLTNTYCEQYVHPLASPSLSNNPYYLSNDDHPRVSKKGMIQVLGHTPGEGEQHVPIVVRINFAPPPASQEAVYVRLVVGNRAVTTTVRKLINPAEGQWRLDGLAPPLNPEHVVNGKVKLSVQALSGASNILDSVTFAYFTYWNTERSPARLPRSPRDNRFVSSSQSSCSSADSSHTPPTSPYIQMPVAESQPMSQRRSARSHLPTPSPEIVNQSIRRGKAPRKTARPQLYARNINVGRAPKSYGSTTQESTAPVLDITTPLQNMCVDWTADEEAAGRRLVRFSRVQDGCRIVVSCDAIVLSEYRREDSVISCIYRPDTNNFYITSFDIIHLLERICNDTFPVEEKNRIRRNLEGFQPTTLSKQKAKSKVFFQTIMDFPVPKPRNIEKDLKVFEWSVLHDALNNIFSRYTVFSTENASSDPGIVAPIPTNQPGFAVDMIDLRSPQHTPEFSAVKFETPDSPVFFPSAPSEYVTSVEPMLSSDDDSPYMPCIPLAVDDLPQQPQMYYNVDTGEFPHPILPQGLNYRYSHDEYSTSAAYIHASPELSYLSSPDYPNIDSPEFGHEQLEYAIHRPDFAVSLVGEH